LIATIQQSFYQFTYNLHISRKIFLIGKDLAERDGLEDFPPGGFRPVQLPLNIPDGKYALL
jgi:hypothetical protein